MRALQLYEGAMSGDQPSYLKLRYTIENLTKNPSAQIVRYGHARPGILSMAQGEGEAPTPDFIIQGALKALQEGKTFYTPVLGIPELRQEIANYYVREYGFSLPTDRIFVTASGTTAIHLVLTALLDPGDEVVAVTPIWKNLLGATELQQASIKEVALSCDQDGIWSLDLQKLFDACTSKTKILLITTPSNPTGWTMAREEMKQVLDFARANDLWIVSDEVYGRLVYDGSRAPSFLDVAAPEDRLFTINSFSKAWAMTGWRLGWIVGPAEAESAIYDIALYDNMCPPSFTQYGAIEALRHGEAFLKEQITLWDNNRSVLKKRFDQMDRIRSAIPPATFYTLFQVDGEPDCLALARRLIDEVGLCLAPGCSFGKIGRGSLRLCFAVSEAKLNDALDRLESAIG
ncbi:MAG: pyridoxal phosphate-dependent aminotransferase [Alphaproteobacteria bacterium]|nr:pyridoxal phosphate-dependent aminotransferase [Alphaproteobacteria bacterium]